MPSCSMRYARLRPPSLAEPAIGVLTMRSAVLAFTLLLLASCTPPAGLVAGRCRVLTPGAVATATQAVLAARAAWNCSQPDVEHTGEADWLQHDRAERRLDVWYVGSLLPEGYAGGGLVIEVSAKNGAIIDAYLTQ